MTDILTAKPADAQTASPIEHQLPKPSESVTVIVPSGGWKALNLIEMRRYRELLYYLAWRDVKVRYKQSLLGAAWAILQPLMYMLVFCIVFFRIANAPSDGIPYPLFSFCGLALWMFFSTAVTQAGNSVIGSEALITKVYFPRLAIPFASVGAALFDFAITFVVLLALIGYYVFFPANAPPASPEVGPIAADVASNSSDLASKPAKVAPKPTRVAVISAQWTLLLVPPLVLLTILAALGVGAFLAALNVSYRDFKHTIPFLVQLWMFATPAIYMGEDHEPPLEVVAQHSSQNAPATASVTAPRSGQPTHSSESKQPPAASGGVVPSWIHYALKFNPLTGLVRSFRAALLGQPMPWNHLAYSTVIVLLTFVISCFYFHRVEDTFADII